MIATIIFIAAVVVAAIVVCWAIRSLAAAFGPPDPARGQIVTVLVVAVVLIALVVILAHLGYVR